MRYTPQHQVLSELLGEDWKDINKIQKGVYEWRGIYYEVVGYTKITAPHSHYVYMNRNKKKWALRELGNKSQIMKDIKNETERLSRRNSKKDDLGNRSTRK